VPIGDIKTAKQEYYKRARKAHPDKTQGKGTEDEIKALNEAWRVINDHKNAQKVR
jgi:curved DNA-binding protein CbpA